MGLKGHRCESFPLPKSWAGFGSAPRILSVALPKSFSFFPKMLDGHTEAKFWKLLRKIPESALVVFTTKIILHLPRFLILQEEKLLGILKYKISGCILDTQKKFSFYCKAYCFQCQLFYICSIWCQAVDGIEIISQYYVILLAIFHVFL